MPAAGHLLLFKGDGGGGSSSDRDLQWFGHELAGLSVCRHSFASVARVLEQLFGGGTYDPLYL